MRIRSLLLLYCLISVPTALFAGPSGPSWEFAGWYGGGCYPNIEFSPQVKDRVYLTSDVAGIWRSDDLGENWHFITKGLGNLNVSILAAAPSDANVLYAGTADGVFVSRDAGESWRPTDGEGRSLRFHRPDSHRSIAVSGRNPSHVMAGTSEGKIYYSEDFGTKWRLLGDRSPIGRSVPIVALEWVEEQGIVYAASSEGLARYSFDTAQWELFHDSPKDLTDVRSASDLQTLYAAGQNKLWTSRDGGKTWGPGGLIPEGVLYRLLVANDGTKRLFAAWNDGWKGGVLVSEDEGGHWKPWDREMAMDRASNPTRAWAGVHGRINALKADPSNDQCWFRTDWWGVWRSDDGGRTWAEKIKGAPNTVMTDIAVVADGSIYTASMDDGLLKSRDGGKNYEPLFPSKGYADDVNGHVWRVLGAGDGILATSSPWGLEGDQVIVSKDGGASFKRSSKGLPARRPRSHTVWERGYARAIAIHPASPETVYMGIDGDDGGGFFISKDGGVTWVKTKGQPGSLKIYNGLAVDPEDPQRILWGASGKKGSLYLSENGGQDWRSVGPSTPKIFDVIYGEGGHAYAGGEDAGAVLYSSEDSGRTWKLLKRFDSDGSVKGLCVLPDGRLVVGTTRWNGASGGKVFLSSADRVTWEDISGDLPEGVGPAAFAFDAKQKTLYLARLAGGVYKTRIEVEMKGDKS